MLGHRGLGKSKFDDHVTGDAGLTGFKYPKNSQPRRMGEGLRHHRQVDVIGRLRYRCANVDHATLVQVRRRICLSSNHSLTITDWDAQRCAKAGALCVSYHSSILTQRILSDTVTLCPPTPPSSAERGFTRHSATRYVFQSLTN